MDIQICRYIYLLREKKSYIHTKIDIDRYIATVKQHLLYCEQLVELLVVGVRL